jgi:undecaprenyl-diphosphatase
MNDSIFLFFHNFANQSAFVDQVIVFFSYFFPFVVVFLAAIFLLKHHEVLNAESPWRAFLEKKREVLESFFTGIFAWIIARVLKVLFATARPIEALANINPLIEKSDFSFPSGHATFFMALAFSIFYFHKKAGYFFIACALVIGVARIMAGVHYPVDILGGFVLGALIAYLVEKI